MRALALLVCLAAILAAPSTASAATEKTSKAVWLCKPGLKKNPCTADLTTTVVAAGGSTTVERQTPARAPKFDCFYVYPTVSGQFRPAATLRVDPEEREVATQHASRFSPLCRVFAPMYRQITVAALIGTKPASQKDRDRAYQDVRNAWREYLARYNKGRGVVLIGHSQGTFELKDLVAKEIDRRSSVRKRLISALLLGGNVQVPVGKDVGGDFANVPACRSATQIGCVVAYSSFSKAPPAGSLFGRTGTPGREILCTNPAALAGGAAPVTPYVHAKPFPGPLGPFVKPIPSVPTPWASYPSLFAARCASEGGANWLQIDDVRAVGDARPTISQTLGPLWGLHLLDVNIALPQLVDLVRSESDAYLK